MIPDWTNMLVVSYYVDSNDVFCNLSNMINRTEEMMVWPR